MFWWHCGNCHILRHPNEIDQSWWFQICMASLCWTNHSRFSWPGCDHFSTFWSWYILYIYIWVVVSNIFYVHYYLGKIPILTNFFSKGLKPPIRYRFMNCQPLIFYLLVLGSPYSIGIPVFLFFNAFDVGWALWPCSFVFSLYIYILYTPGSLYM